MSRSAATPTVHELAQKAAAGELAPVVCLYGEERFLVERATEAIRDAVVAVADRDFNLHVFDGRDLSVDPLVSALQTLPVFAERKLVLIRHADALSSAALERLADYAAAPADDTLVLVVAAKPDLRRRLYQVLRKRGGLIEYKALKEHQVPDAVRREARHLEVNLSEEALKLFCRRVGAQLETIHAELQKLALFCHGRCVIDRPDVERLVCDTQGENIFALTNAIGGGQAECALALLEGLLLDGEPPLRILTMIVRHLRQLWKAREGIRLGLPRRELAGHVGINPYFLDGVLAQAKPLSDTQLATALQLTSEADLQLKSSGASAEAVMTSLVLALVRSVRAAATA